MDELVELLAQTGYSKNESWTVNDIVGAALQEGQRSPVAHAYGMSLLKYTAEFGDRTIGDIRRLAAAGK